LQVIHNQSNINTAQNPGLIQPKLGCFSCSLVSSQQPCTTAFVPYKFHYS